MSSRPRNQENLHLIPQTHEYRKTHQPLLSQQKTASIQQKLKLQKQALMHTRQRQGNMDYYIKYNYNPFLEYKGQESMFIKDLLKNRKGQVVNIANKLAEISVERPVVKADIQAKSVYMKGMKYDFQLFSDKILNNLLKEQSQGAEKQDSSPLNAFRVKPTQNQSSEEQVEPKEPTDQHISRHDIESIAVIKQENFFLKHYKKANIFKIARGDDDELSSRQIMRKFHFCNNSIVQRISKIKLPIYRDISTLGRKVIMGQQTGNQNIVDYVDSYQLSFKLKQIWFHDIMSIASNRFSADFLNRMLNFEQSGNKDMSDTSSEQKDETAIIYRQNQECVEQNFVNSNQEQQEIKDYKLLKNNQMEKRYEKKYANQQIYIENKLQLRKNLRGNTVKDIKLHKDIDNDIQNAFNNFLGLDEHKMDADRLVRFNKTCKNKTEATKTKILLETIAYKNKQDELINLNKNMGKKQ